MRSILTIGVVAFGLMIAQPGMARIEAPDLVQVGAGAAFLGNDGTVDALIEVEAQAAEATDSFHTYVIAHIKGDAAIGSEGLTYLDITFEAIGSKWGDEKNYVEADLLGLNVSRNVAVNNSTSVRLTLGALKGALESEISPEVKFLLSGTLDLLSLSYTRRQTDGADLLGWGPGFTVETGVEIIDRIRITLGEKLGGTLGAPEEVYTGQDCYYDSYYNDFHCTNQYATKWNDVRGTSSTFFQIVARITEGLQIFGRAEYNLYSVSDNSGGGTPPSDNGKWQFLLGAKYRF